ncbi:MAG: hypothetical protein JXR13_13520 [Thalassovita sp.]
MELLLLLSGVLSIGMLVFASPDANDPSAAENIEGSNDNDTINGLNGDDTIFGGDGDDSLVGGGGSDFIYAGTGDDRVDEHFYLRMSEEYPDGYFDGNDTVFGGEGDDFLRSHDGDDSVDGGSGADTLLGGNGDDRLTGGSGNDDVSGMEGHDIIEGGTGDDTLSGGAGIDSIWGGDGNDVINDSGRDSGDNSLAEFLDGGAGDDLIYFGDGSTVTGGAGADSFFTAASMSNNLVSEITDFDPTEDTLFVDLGAGNGHGGDFSLVEREDGQGRDLYLGEELVVRLSGATPFTLDDITLGHVRLETDDETPVEYTIGDSENGFGTRVISAHGDDIISGSSAGDVIINRAGSDVINGGEGNDTIFADGGNAETDTLSPHGGDSFSIVDYERDTVDGGDGDDIIRSFNGNDLTGGEGEDVFVLVNNSAAFEEHEDVIGDGPNKLDPTIITDFTPGEDSILVRGLSGRSLDTDDVSITPSADGTAAELTVEGQIVAIIVGGQDLTLDDIAIEELPSGQYVPYGEHNLIPEFNA